MNDIPETAFKLMDHAQGNIPLIAEEIRDQKLDASDKTLDIDTRLEIFEDIIASEVGDTLFARARNIERETGLRQIYFKFEGGNPSGTQKDRIAFAQVEDALRRGSKASALLPAEITGLLLLSPQNWLE